MENNQEKPNYGKVVTPEGQLAVIDFVRAQYKDHRVISVASVEDGSFIISVENPESTGRNPSNKMWLSKESLVGLFSTISLLFEAKDMDMRDLLNDTVDPSRLISYELSPNLKRPFEDEQV